MLKLEDFREFKVTKLENLSGGYNNTVLNGTETDVVHKYNDGSCDLWTNGGQTVWECDSNCDHCKPA